MSMSSGRMHVDEVATDSSLVGRLLAEQFPQWADLPVVPVRSAGTDKAIYRFGADMAVRLPRIHLPHRLAALRPRRAADHSRPRNSTYAAYNFPRLVQR